MYKALLNIIMPTRTAIYYCSSMSRSRQGSDLLMEVIVVLVSF